MSQILALRASIAAKLREVLPGIDVQEFPRANLTPKDIDAALINRVLAVRVLFRGVQEEGTRASSNQVDVPQSWGIAIIARDGKKAGVDDLPRDVKILRILPVVLGVVAGDHWDVEDDDIMSQPRRILAEELYGGDEDLAAHSAMVWGVTWVQTASISADAGDLKELLWLITRYDLAPGDGADEAEDVIEFKHEEP